MNWISNSWRRWFKRQVDDWVESGIIDSKQRQKILNRYPENNFGPGPLLAQNRLLALFGLLGALLVGIGIILFVAANWQQISPLFKVLLLVSSVITFYLGGYYLRFEREGYESTGGALLFLGHLAFGASIWLIGQIYHLPVRFPQGFMYWTLGTTAMSLALNLLPGLVLSNFLTGAWLYSAFVFTLMYPGEGQLGLKSIYQPAIWLYPLLAVVLLRAVYRDRTRAGLFFWLGANVLWLAHLAHRWASNFTAEASFVPLVLVLAGGFYYWLADFTRNRGLWPESAVIFSWWTWLCVFPVLYFYSFKYPAKKYLEHVAAPQQLFLASFLAVGIGGLWIWRAVYGSRQNTLQKVVNLLGFSLVFIVVFLGQLGGGLAVASYVITVNLVAFSFNLGYVARGATEANTSLTVAGLLGFGLVVLALYFSFAWELLSRSVFFITGGLILLVFSFLFEFVRRRLAGAEARREV